MKSLFLLIFIAQACASTAIAIGIINLIWVTMYHPPFEKFLVMGMTAPASIAVSLNGTAIFVMSRLLRILLSRFGPGK